MSDLITLAQVCKGYRYNTDSLLLCDFVLKQGVRNDTLDLGAGCGIIGILLKKNIANLNLFLMDIQEENISLINKNLKDNQIQASVFHSDFKHFKSSQNLTL